MQLLTHRQIRQKIERLAIQLLENNYTEPALILAGINNKGAIFANLLYDELIRHAHMPIQRTNIRLNPAAPHATPVEIDLLPEDLHDRTIIVIDDVANTGRTLFYACKPFLDLLPRKIEMAVLVDRKHKSFPVLVDYVGLSLATTLREHIEVDLSHAEQLAAYLRSDSHA